MENKRKITIAFYFTKKNKSSDGNSTVNHTRVRINK